MIKLIFISLLLFGCASREEQIKSFCHPEGAYAKGYRDGKDNALLSSSALNFCPDNGKNFYSNYKEGYLEGQRNRLKEPNSSALGSSPNASQPRKCILRFRGDAFLGEGFSYGEAQQNALKKCQNQYGNTCPMVCENL